MGAGATDITNTWPCNVQVRNQALTVIEDNREREQRQLLAEFIAAQGDACLIDDVCVSGMTLQTAQNNIKVGSGGSVEAFVGLRYNSKRARKRAGIAITSAIDYAQEGGGIVPVNSFSTLLSDDKLLADYSLRKFGDTAALDWIKEYGGEKND